MADAPVCRYRSARAPVLLLRERRQHVVYRNARDVALRILAARFGDPPADAPAEGLFDFQRVAVARARAILRRRHGVLIADGVGLGKTHVAVALAREALALGQTVVVIAPAALRRHWRAAMADPRVEIVSYSRLGRNHIPRTAGLVVFDEAHALRNPATQRYRAAARLCEGAAVVLLSATPVNNSPWDLYHLLSLFAGDGEFGDVGVPSLRSAFDEAASTCLIGAAPSLEPVLREIMIRRTRAFVRATSEPLRELRFPAQRPPKPVHYEFADAELIERIAQALMRLTFPAHGSSHGSAPADLMRVALLKRLESSTYAFHRSVARYAALLGHCRASLDRGLLVRARDDPASRSDDAQLRFDELLFEPVASRAQQDRYRGLLDAELRTVRELVVPVDAASDAKLAALLALLHNELRDAKVVVFTQFLDTVRWLHDRLRSRFRVALIDGSGALLGGEPVDRLAVVRRFAPLANGAAPPPERETVDVLIATDVLSEGVNLQDASAVVSYDLPWNPIRVVQRVGRVDRIGSMHARVASYHFLPGQLERYLGVVERVARKGIAIEATVGSDMPLLHASLARALGRGDIDALDRAESDDAGVLEVDERLRQLQRAQHRPLHVPEDALPVGVIAPPPDQVVGDRPSGVVAAIVGARFQWAAVIDGRVVADERAAAAFVERACTQQPVARRVPRERISELLHAARRAFVERAAALDAVPALLPPAGAGASIGRRILTLAAALPGGPAPALCGRIESALERLALTPEAALRALPEANGLEALLGGVESLRPASHVAARPLRDPAGQRAVCIVGLLIEDQAAR